MPASTPTTTELKSAELPIDALPKVYWAIVSSSTSTEAQWKELCNTRLFAECTGCKIKLTGLEPRLLAGTHHEGEQESPKLERLRKNYCARSTCESRCYRVDVLADSEKHWVSNKEQLQVATPELRETSARRERKPFFGGTGVPKFSPARLVGLLVLGVVLFFVVRHFVYGSRIPLIQKKNEYRV